MTRTDVQPAAVGRTLTVIGKGIESNGATSAPAVVTRVWGPPDSGNGKQLVNLTIFPDLAAPKPQGSVYLYPTATEARAAVTQEYGADHMAAHWPERS